MKKCIRNVSVLALNVLLILPVAGQNIPLNTWRTHFSYTNARLLTKSQDKIFCVAENGLFSIGLTTNEIAIHTKINGLSDVGASAIAYDPRDNMLLIGYPSGLLDIVSENEVITLREIYETNLQGSKRIQDITVYEDQAFLATSFGAIVVDLDRKEITDTYGSIGPDGSDITLYELQVIDDRLFATTDIGIQSGLLSVNLLDFNNWIHYENPGEDVYYEFAFWQDTVFSIRNNNALVKLVNNSWVEVSSPPESNYIKLLTTEEGLYVLSPEGIDTYNQGSISSYQSFSEHADASDFIHADGFWVADGTAGLLDPAGNSVLPNGPLSDQINKIRYLNSSLYAFYAPEPSSYFGQIIHNKINYFNDEQWETDPIPDFFNISDGAYFNGDLYFSSTGYGLYNYSQSILWDHTNSLLEPGKTNTGPILSGLATGRNLFITSFNSPTPLYSLSGDQELIGYSEDYVNTDKPVSVDISMGGVLWLTRSAIDGGGIITLNTATDEFRLITQEDGLPASGVADIAINSTDESWIATSSGPSFIEEATFIFNDIEATRPIFGGFTLFDNQPITAILTDGGDRVWMGSPEGLWVFDDAVSREVHHFTERNSPLPSNRIKDLSYNPANGEVFILTDRGLISFRSSSSRPSPVHQSVSIFPNPVTPGYQGLVGITGLAGTAEVKVTDVNGKLIRELEVEGGTASWNLLDYNNHKVQDGVYIVFSATFDGEETYIGKIAVIN